MGRQYGLGLEITDKELYIRIKRSSFKIFDEKGKVIDKYIDFAHFFGIRDIKYGEEGDTNLTEEEMLKLVELTQFKRVRCGYISIGRWMKKEGKAWVCFRGWNDVPYGVVEYISKLYPEVEFEITEAWDDEEFDGSPHSYKYFLKNGILTKKITEVWGGKKDNGNGIWQKVEIIYDEKGNQIGGKVLSAREVDPEDARFWDNLYKGE